MHALFKDRKVILAPMAGVTDEIFRSICLSMGADLTVSEMISAKALSYSSAKTQRLLVLAPQEQKIMIQLFGHEPAVMAQEARLIEEEIGERLFSIDVNMGCPAKKIAGKGDGAALMKDPVLAGKIIEAIVQAVKIPVTVKIRRGYEIDNETAAEFASMLEQSGAAGITVHGRFAQQFYHGKACWDTIARVKERVTIPVVGNGDIVSGRTAQAMIDQTGCDAVMVGRAARGYPWVFQDIRASLSHKTSSFVPPSNAERIKLAKRHARLLADRDGEVITKMRKQAMWYIHGIPGATETRRKINYAVTYEDFEAIFDQLIAYQEKTENRG